MSTLKRRCVLMNGSANVTTVFAQQWNGRVFLNPPYGQPDCSNFVEKLCADYAAGNVPSAVLLTDNRTDTRWWHLAATTSAAICFTLGRINFQKEGGSGGGYTNGQTFFYLGSDVDAFITEFSPFGLIWNRIVSISKPSPGLGLDLEKVKIVLPKTDGAKRLIIT